MTSSFPVSCASTGRWRRSPPVSAFSLSARLSSSALMVREDSAAGSFSFRIRHVSVAFKQRGKINRPAPSVKMATHAWPNESGRFPQLKWPRTCGQINRPAPRLKWSVQNLAQRRLPGLFGEKTAGDSKINRRQTRVGCLSHTRSYFYKIYLLY